ncbi:hypothetical protein COT69_02620 [candidate division WWE3 bacterium CG09_land_8_20_14_0_10_39_24]|uniref:Uncharacterized protein n=1 Tax=candidate division WWE3 bacterium CG09_land_8_20_14_0_10_39_24 TaxID=1975088 RepID=A0A2H0WJ66_UNCKA|nr:MAG: hypothetical protein COT69_02620 [candidate division WWE3 bacterium CG09_land_8_20_14_0_10_39_24]
MLDEERKQELEGEILVASDEAKRAILGNIKIDVDSTIVRAWPCNPCACPVPDVCRCSCSCPGACW